MTTLHVASDGFRCHIWQVHTYALFMTKHRFNSSINIFIATLEDS